MPVTSEHFTLSTVTATQIVRQHTEPQQVTVHNAENAENTEVYVGNSSVSVSNGIHVHSGENLQFVLPPGDGLWAIADADSPVVQVMRVTQH